MGHGAEKGFEHPEKLTVLKTHLQMILTYFDMFRRFEASKLVINCGRYSYLN